MLLSFKLHRETTIVPVFSLFDRSRDAGGAREGGDRYQSDLPSVGGVYNFRGLLRVAQIQRWSPIVGHRDLEGDRILIFVENLIFGEGLHSGEDDRIKVYIYFFAF